MPRGGARPGSGPKKIPPEEKQRVTSFTLSPKLVDKLKKHAEEAGKSRSMIVEAALRAYLD